MENEYTLSGCLREPFGSYLKALGVFRILSTQKDPAAKCYWDSTGVFDLVTKLSKNELIDFLLSEYCPTPILSPWNKDSGFKAKSSKNSTLLNSIVNSSDPRFSAYKTSITVAESVLEELFHEYRFDTNDVGVEEQIAPEIGNEDDEINQSSEKSGDDKPAVLSLKGKYYVIPPKQFNAAKSQIILQLRNRLPDDALTWLDSSAILLSKEVAFPPLFGTGGNFGRLDIAPVYMGKLLDVFDSKDEKRKRSESLLKMSLFCDQNISLETESAGQYDPGAAGGVRAGSFGKPDALTNPWDWILAIEGSLFWSSGVSRRMEGSQDKYLSMPFCFRSSPVGYSSSAESEELKGELWAPIWPNPVRLESILKLFQNGMINWNDRQANNGIEAAMALSSFGVESGISEFTRFVVANRLGQNPLIIQAGVYPVRFNHFLSPVNEIYDWIKAFEGFALRNNPVKSHIDAVRKLRTALLEASNGGCLQMQNLLTEVSKAERLASNCKDLASDRGLMPVPWLDADKWYPSLDDGTPEFRVAASLATMFDPFVKNGRHGFLRGLLTKVAPLNSDDQTQKSKNKFSPGYLKWAETSEISGLYERKLEAILDDVLILRSWVERSNPKSEIKFVGIEPWFPNAHDVFSGDAELFATNSLDNERIKHLLCGLLFIEPRRIESDKFPKFKEITQPFKNTYSPLWRFLAPFYTRHDAARTREYRLRPLSHWATLITGNRFPSLIDEVSVRYRIARRIPMLPNDRGSNFSNYGFVHGSLLVSPPWTDVMSAYESQSRKSNEKDET